MKFSVKINIALFGVLCLSCAGADFFGETKTGNSEQKNEENSIAEQGDESSSEEDQPDTPVWINGVSLTCTISNAAEPDMVQASCSIYDDVQKTWRSPLMVCLRGGRHLT